MRRSSERAQAYTAEIGIFLALAVGANVQLHCQIKATIYSTVGSTFVYFKSNMTRFIFALPSKYLLFHSPVITRHRLLIRDPPILVAVVGRLFGTLGFWRYGVSFDCASQHCIVCMIINDAYNTGLHF